MRNGEVKREAVKRDMKEKNIQKLRIGPVGMKVLLLLGAGTTLALVHRPDTVIRVIKQVPKAWKEINRRALQKSIRALYESKMVDYKELSDGSIVMTLSEEGKKQIVHYHIDKMQIEKPARWDGMWRLVLFDIPERHKKGRDALSAKLKNIGFYSLQKSVFIYPYECKKEVDFIVEFFEVRPFVRFLLVKETDIDLDLKHNFKL